MMASQHGEDDGNGDGEVSEEEAFMVVAAIEWIWLEWVNPLTVPKRNKAMIIRNCTLSTIRGWFKWQIWPVMDFGIISLFEGCRIVLLEFHFDVVNIVCDSVDHFHHLKLNQPRLIDSFLFEIQQISL